MIGYVKMENGTESMFFLSESDVDVLERETAEVRELDANPSYSIADELATEAIPGWINHLRTVQGRGEKVIRGEDDEQTET